MKQIKRDFRSKAWLRPPGWAEATIQHYQNMVMLHIKLKGISHVATWYDGYKYFARGTPDPGGGGGGWVKIQLFQNMVNLKGMARMQ